MWQSPGVIGHGAGGKDDLSDGVDDGDVEDGAELAEEGVGEESAKERGEVGEEDESVVEDRAHVLGLVRLHAVRADEQVLQVQGQDGWKLNRCLFKTHF